MKNIFLFLIFFSGLLFAENIKFYKPSFDCNNVKKNSIEYMICTNEILAILDIRLSSIYKEIININSINKVKVEKEQKEWIKNRNKCKYRDYKCIKNSYKNRIEKLNYIYDLVIKNDFSPYERIQVLNPDEEYSLEKIKYNFYCIYNKNSKSLIISRDKDFYLIDKLSQKIPQPTKYDADWQIFVHERKFVNNILNNGILKGTILLNNGATYQPTSIEFFTYSKNWNCKLKEHKN